MKTQSIKFSIFKNLGQGIRSVHLDWFGNDTAAAVAKGFREAADGEVLRASNDVRHPDRSFWPVAFLYRHSIELFLKEIIRSGSELLEQPCDFHMLHGHKLDILWSSAKSKLVSIWPTGDQVELEPIERVVQDLNRADPRGDAFRYRWDTKQRLNLCDLPRVLSLEHLGQACDEAIDMLEGILMGIEEFVARKQEMQSELLYDKDWE